MAKAALHGWGQRFKILAKARGYGLPKIAEKMELAESTLRSWTNGTREINLSDFFLMCESAEVRPSDVLFEGRPAGREFAWSPEAIELADGLEQTTGERRATAVAVMRTLIGREPSADHVEKYADPKRRPPKKPQPVRPRGKKRETDK